MRETEPSQRTVFAPAGNDRGDLSSLPGPILAQRVRAAGLDLASVCGERGETDPTRLVAHDEFERLLSEVERRLEALA